MLFPQKCLFNSFRILAGKRCYIVSPNISLLNPMNQSNCSKQFHGKKLEHWQIKNKTYFDFMATCQTLENTLKDQNYQSAAKNLQFLKQRLEFKNFDCAKCYMESLQIINNNLKHPKNEVEHCHPIMKQIVQDFLIDRIEYSVTLRDFTMYIAAVLGYGEMIESLVEKSYQLTQHDNGDLYYAKPLTQFSYESILKYVECKAYSSSRKNYSQLQLEESRQTLSDINSWVIAAINSKKPKSMPHTVEKHLPNPVGIKTPDLPNHPLRMNSTLLRKYLGNWTALENTSVALKVFERCVALTYDSKDQNMLFRSILSKWMKYANFKLVMNFLGNANTAFKLLDLDAQSYYYIFRLAALHDRPGKESVREFAVMALKILQLNADENILDAVQRYASKDDEISTGTYLRMLLNISSHENKQSAKVVSSASGDLSILTPPEIQSNISYEQKI